MKTLVSSKNLTVEQHGKFIVIRDDNKAIVVNTKSSEWEIHIEGELQELSEAKFDKSFKLTGVQK